MEKIDEMMIRIKKIPYLEKMDQISNNIKTLEKNLRSMNIPITVELPFPTSNTDVCEFLSWRRDGISGLYRLMYKENQDNDWKSLAECSFEIRLKMNEKLVDLLKEIERMLMEIK